MSAQAHGVHWPSILRGVVLFVFAAVLLHLLGAKVGVWANGSLGPVATLLVGVAAPAWFFVCFPTWFGWRIARPIGLRRLAWFVSWFSPLVGRHDLKSLRIFLAVEAEQGFPDTDAIPADAWTALAAALQADRQGNAARAHTLVDALHCLPQESAFPWLARCHGAEALVLAAWQRRDLQAVLDYAAIGRGRCVRLLGLLARVALGQAIPSRVLWWAWILSPVRRRTLEDTRRATARTSGQPKVTPAPTRANTMVDACPAVDVRARHVALLASASRGEAIAACDLLALARAWHPLLDKPGLARLSARALELDARDASGQAQALRASVLAELIVLATACDGKVAAADDQVGLLGELVSGLREQLCQDVEAGLASINPDSYTPGIHPLEAWERWLALRNSLDRLAVQDSAAFVALWNGRVAGTVWNWTCAVFNCHRKRSAWVAHMMYLWIAEQAELMGDMRTMVVNRENARIALGV